MDEPQTSHFEAAIETSPGVTVAVVESSSADESCSAYITRKWEQLGETH